MGVCVSMRNVDFSFKASNTYKILDLLRKYAEEHGVPMWCDKDIFFDDGYGLYQVFEEIGYTLNNNGLYFEIECFNNEKLGEEFDIFNYIAPYIIEGSYIEYSADDNDLFRYVINEGKCKEIRPEIKWN